MVLDAKRYKDMQKTTEISYNVNKMTNEINMAKYPIVSPRLLPIDFLSTKNAEINGANSSNEL